MTLVVDYSSAFEGEIFIFKDDLVRNDVNILDSYVRPLHPSDHCWRRVIPRSGR
jgi:hypothetical protein